MGISTAVTTTDRSLAVELVRVTEAAAISASRCLGRGDKNQVDGIRPEVDIAVDPWTGRPWPRRRSATRSAWWPWPSAAPCSTRDRASTSASSSYWLPLPRPSIPRLPWRAVIAVITDVATAVGRKAEDVTVAVLDRPTPRRAGRGRPRGRSQDQAPA
jgi:hypothetical protein